MTQNESAAAHTVGTAQAGEAARRFVARPHKLLIGGHWVDAQSGATFTVLDPSDDVSLAQVAEAGAADVDRAVAAARDAFENGPWAAMKPTERGKLLWRLADLLEQHVDEISDIEALDAGKPLDDTKLLDVPFCCELIRYMAGWSTKITGNAINISEAGEWHAYTRREPLGVAGLIVPWNFPILLAVWKIAPALAAGCTVVVKPAEQAPLSMLRFAELFEQAGFPPGVVNVVTGRAEAGRTLASHPDVDKLSFTGSTNVGREILKSSANNFKKLTLELGGKSPMIILPDADLDLAIPGAAAGIFFNQGQTCTASSRLLVHASVFDRVVAGVAAEAEKIRIGRAIEPTTQMGPVISREHAARVFEFIEKGRQDGAEVVTGGRRFGETGYFVEPTILADVGPDNIVGRDEIFGPVLAVTRFTTDDLGEIAKLANASEFGLSASVWTQNVSTAHRLSARIKAGTVWINTHNINDIALPFGGYKQSGWGREMGFDAVESYLQTKSVMALL